MKLKNSRFMLILSILLVFSGCASTGTESTAEPKQKPIRHLQIDDVATMEDAQRIFIETTAEIRSKTKLDIIELQEIHFMTYTLEKSVAYLAENLTGEGQQLAKEVAVIVEDIHINSENNFKVKTQQHLTKYFGLADQIISGF